MTAQPTHAPAHADVVVIGAGSSGGVVAARLSEDPDRTVVVLEAGPDFPDEAADPPAFLVGGGLMGGGFAGAGAATPDLDWGYWSEPIDGERRVHLHRGRLVGGSSMVNGCVAVRGAPADFGAWEATAGPVWAWSAVVPFYERVERQVPIRTYPRETWQPIQRAFHDGFSELGFRQVPDINAPDAWDGVVGAWPQNRHNEIRQGTLVSYLRPARERANLTVVDRALVDRVDVRGGRATGVRYIRGGHRHRIEAGEIVVCAGAYGSPAVLQRSGVGPAGVLERAGVPVHLELPVGQRLLDHPQCLFLLNGPPELAQMVGPGFAVVARGDGYWSFAVPLDEATGLIGLAFGLGEQEPRGTVTIASGDPTSAPLIDHHYREVLGSRLFDVAWRDFQALCATEAMRGQRVHGGDIGGELLPALRERLGTAYHCAGSCPIGDVLDAELRVLGVDGLRVADASVFPTNVSNNPNLTCFMVGERAAALMGAPPPSVAVAR
jgi:choline dehydrogenase